MWTHVKEAPQRLCQLGLGAEPVYAASENAWYAMSGERIMRHAGVGSTAQPDTYGPDYRSYALRRMQIPGLYGVPAGFAGLQNAPTSQTTDLVLLASAHAVMADPNPCDLHGSTNGNPAVNAFQQAWNSTNDATITGDPGYAQLTVDGQYGQNTTDALSAALGSGFSVPGPCTGNYINPPGGGQPSPPPPNPNPPAPTPAASGSNYTVPILVGAGVVAAGLVGWAVFHKPKKKHVQHAARAAEEESRYHARRARRLREAAKSY
jgi:hypothetical protein